MIIFKKGHFLILVIILLVASSQYGYSQTPVLVQDVYSGSFDLPFNRNSLIEFRGSLYLLANDGINGRELWRSDGDTAVLVQDIRAGIEGSNPEFFTIIGDQLVFRAFDDIHGAELWTFDGDTAVLIQDLWPGILGSGPRELFAFNDEVFFQADDGTTGLELWKYDGTSISLVANIRENDENAVPADFVSFQGDLYFRATNGDKGLELWKYDGETVTLVQDINRGANAEPRNFKVLGDRLYFTADDGIHGEELWKYDGDTAVLAFDINPSGSSSPHDLVALGDELLFAANDGTSGQELWRYDGSTATLVKDINPGGAGLPLDTIVKAPGSIYFSADDGVNGQELWKYDGVEATMVEDINPGSLGSSPGNFGVFGTNLYFSAADNTADREFYRFDGEEINAFDLNTSASSNPSFMTRIGCNLFFGAEGSVEQGTELWILNAAGDSEGVINEQFCGEIYTAPDGQAYTISGDYSAIVPNIVGCDSLISINLIINRNSSSSIAEVACQTYVAPDGQVYTEDGIFTAIIPNTVGCDSTITIDLTVVNLNTNVNIDGLILTAEATGVTYQWLDCANDFAPIPGATSQSFTPPSSGEFVVELTDTNGCVDTTACINGIVSSLGDTDFKKKISLSPTITSDITYVSLDRVYNKVAVSVISMTGQVMSLQTFEAVDAINLELPTAKGYYLVEVQIENTLSETFRVVKL